MLTAISAGWALAVSVSSASGPSNISCESFCASARVDALEHLARDGKLVGERLAHADRLRPLTRKHQGRLHDPVSPPSSETATRLAPRRKRLHRHGLGGAVKRGSPVEQGIDSGRPPPKP